eukprot:jgi/Hompol1/95/HPOL_004488-RA
MADQQQLQNNVSIDAPIIASHNDYLLDQTSSIRSRTIPWEGYQRAGLLSESELAQIRQFEKSPQAALAQSAEEYVDLFVSLLAKLVRSDTLQSILVLLDDVLRDSPPSSPRPQTDNDSESVADRAKSIEEAVLEPFTKLKTEPEESHESHDSHESHTLPTSMPATDETAKSAKTDENQDSVPLASSSKIGEAISQGIEETVKGAVGLEERIRESVSHAIGLERTETFGDGHQPDAPDVQHSQSAAPEQTMQVPEASTSSEPSGVDRDLRSKYWFMRMFGKKPQPTDRAGSSSGLSPIVTSGTGHPLGDSDQAKTSAETLVDAPEVSGQSSASEHATGHEQSGLELPRLFSFSRLLGPSPPSTSRTGAQEVTPDPLSDVQAG